MAGFCLMPEAINRFKQGLQRGEIDPAKLSEMSSEERNQFFEKYVGKEASKDVNALFESKLLLKNQQRGMVTWAKTVAGLKPEVRRDLVARIQKLDRVLDPGEKEQFLQTLASQKLGVDVSQAEAKTIADLSKAVQDAQARLDAGGDRMAYGRARVALANYVNGLKANADRMTFGELAKHPVAALSKAHGITKALNASMDIWSLGHQGIKTLYTHPGIWLKNAKQAFVDLARQFGGHQVLDEVNADILSRPNAVNGAYAKMKLDVGNLEEYFPTSGPEKLPIFGRAYKATEAAFTAFLRRTRADLADQYLKIADKTGVNTTDATELQSIGKLVNSLTGRGSLGKYEPSAPLLNTVFFSPRMIKSHIDTLTAHALDKGMTSFARKQAAINLFKIVGGTASILVTANAVAPGSVDFDPRSADFGKIKIGDTRFDVTGGMSSLVTLAARLITQSSKSSTTGIVTQLNTGKFGSQTEWDVINNFLDGRLSPVAGVIRDIAKGSDTQGNPVTPASAATRFLTPMNFQDFMNSGNDPNAANRLLTLMMEEVGISASTYGASGLSTSSKNVQDFQQRVGSDKFSQANNEYTAQLSQWEDRVSQDPGFQKLPSATQQKIVTQEKNRLKAMVFNKYQ